MPGRDALADVRDRLGDERAGTGDPVDLGVALADDHALPASPRSSSASCDLAGDLARSDAPRGAGRASPSCGSARRRAPSARGRARAAARSPRARRRARPSSARARASARVATSSARSKNRIASSVRPFSREHRVERLGLREVAREPVEHEARGGVRRDEPVADQRDGQVVGHELAGREDRLHPASQLRPVRDRGAEHVAGGDVRDAVVGRDPLRLRALAGALRAREREVHPRGSPRSSASSSATPSGASCRARRRRRSAPTCRRGRRRSPARSPRSG